jgi:hypothetical protein
MAVTGWGSRGEGVSGGNGLRAAHSYDAHIWRYASQLCAVEGISYAHDMWYAHIWCYARQLCGVRISGAHIWRYARQLCGVRISGAHIWRYASQLCAVEAISYAHDMWYNKAKL